MIKEILKRPFVRLLFVWILGVLLQANYALQVASFGLLVIPFFILFISSLPVGKREAQVSYRGRWVWGGVFLSMLLFLSIQLTAYHERQPAGEPGVLEIKAKEVQERLLAPIGNLSLADEEKAVLSAISLGYRDSMSKEVRRQFSATGVAHILAVSGFHVAVVCGLISFLLSFLPGNRGGRWVKYLLTMLTIWLFTIVSGLAPSAVRAAVMLSLYLTGRQLRRQTDSYNTLAASAFCMLVYNPFYLYDIGFQLSYFAVFFILYLQPVFGRMLDLRNPLLAKIWNCITVTLAAQIGVSFLCMYYFRQFPTVFLFTNVPVTVLATLLTPLALVWLLLPAGLPGMSLMQSAIELLTHWMMQVVTVFSRIPGASLTFDFSFNSLLISYSLLFLLLLYHKNRKKKPIRIETKT